MTPFAFEEAEVSTRGVFGVAPAHLPVMNVGFTGSRNGMTGPQRANLSCILRLLGPKILRAHHGDCIGADAQFADEVHRVVPPSSVVVHPPRINTYRARADRPGNLVLPVDDFRVRDRAIADAALMQGCLIGTPKEEDALAQISASRDRPPRGGTLYTLWYGCGLVAMQRATMAHTRGVVVVLLPAGGVFTLAPKAA